MADTTLPANTQQFADDEIVDNFGEPDDGTPMGLGGEQGKQAEPASTTLEADMVSQDTLPGGQDTPGDDIPPDDTASGEPEPVQDTAGEGGVEPQIPEEPEFPPALLQMAGYATPEDARQAGFSEPEALLAAVQWRSQLLSPQVTPSQEGSVYSQPQQQTPPQGEEPGLQPFQPANADALDEEVLAALQQQQEYFAKQFQQQQERFASELKERDDRTQAQQQSDYENRFDKAVQDLGENWQDVFGKGAAQELAHAGQRDPAAMTAVNHRVMLFSAVEAVRKANQEQGFPALDLEQEVQYALMQRYPDKYREVFQQQLRHKSNGQAQARRGVQASRPTARKTPLGNRNERLVSAVDSMLKAKGRPGLDMGQDEEFDGEI